MASLRALSKQDRARVLAECADEGAGAETGGEDKSIEAGAEAAASCPSPEVMQLWKYFVVTAVPFVGFGFADNSIMILAGEWLDLQLGSTLHLSTLAAAGIGNLISDVIGVGLGGVIEESAARMGIPPHGMTEAQLQLKQSKIAYGLGGVLGITVGCLLGMFPLLLNDPARQQLQKLFHSLDTNGDGSLDESEIRQAFMKINIYMTEKEMAALFSEFDVHEPYGFLDFEEFEKMYNKWSSEMQAKFMSNV